MGKTVYRSRIAEAAFRAVFHDEFEERERASAPVQLELDLNDTECRHVFYDNDDPVRGCGIFCEKCDYFREVSFADPWDGKTYQEIYEMMQRDARLT